MLLFTTGTYGPMDYQEKYQKKLPICHIYKHCNFYKDEHEASTPINHSPELSQFEKGQQVDIRKNDIWAAGCIFFQLLEGKHPFGDGSDFKHNICYGRLPLREFDKKHGEGTKQFLELLWNRDPSERLEPIRALGICGLLLWGAPNVEISSIFRRGL